MNKRKRVDCVVDYIIRKARNHCQDVLVDNCGDEDHCQDVLVDNCGDEDHCQDVLVDNCGDEDHSVPPWDRPLSDWKLLSG